MLPHPGSQRTSQLLPFYLDRMTVNDLDEVAEVEREAFSLPWPSSAYRRELRENRMAHYLVVRRGTPSPVEPQPKRPFPFSLLPQPPRPPAPPGARPNVIGHGGLWMMLDEAHITTIAVRHAYRSQGIGELLLTGLIDHAYEMNARWVTLEVRVSNVVAQNLYRKYGFRQTGIRPKYYSDNHEDAYVMATDPIMLPENRRRYAELKRRLYEKLESRYAAIVPPTPVPIEQS